MKLTKLIFATALIAMASGVFAQEQLTFENIAQVEIAVTNQETGETTTELRDATLVQPGDVVLFTSKFTNASDEAAENVRINNPVPDNMVFLAFSARGEGATVTYSVDGTIFGSPDSLTVVGEDGVERLARPEEYKEIQWSFSSDLAPGSSGDVSFKARLL